MTKDLIRYPAVNYGDEGWRDSGEGGQFFYAVWDSAEPAACSVDAAPSLHMADVLVAAHGPLSESFEEQRRGWYAESHKGNYDKAWQASGVSFDTVLLLGTTNISYFYDDYFAIKSLEDLTDAGRALVESISAVMGTEPTFVSYLDT